jgi:hypothetical protein
VLALAAGSDTLARGMLLLGAYSAGLAVPFLLTALGIGQFLPFYQRFRRYLHGVEMLSGGLLLLVGGLIFVNKLIWLSGKLGYLRDAASILSSLSNSLINVTTKLHLTGRSKDQKSSGPNLAGVAR